MKLTIKSKIITLLIAATALPMIVTFAVTTFQSQTISKTVSAGIGELAESDLRHISENMYNMCATSHDFAIQKAKTGINTTRELVKDYDYHYAKEKIAWNAYDEVTDEVTRYNLPKAMIGKKWMGINRDFGVSTPLVDEVRSITDCRVALFQRADSKGNMICNATNILALDGKSRAIEVIVPPILPNGASCAPVQAVLKGNEFYSSRYVNGDWLLGGYAPYYEKGSVEGMIYVVLSEKSTESVRNAITSQDVGKSGYMYVMRASGDDKGLMLIHPDTNLRSCNVWDSKDSEGNAFFQNIINEAKAASKGKAVICNYDWWETGYDAPRKKISSAVYFPEWDWVVVAGAYLDEFDSANTAATGKLNQLRLFIILNALILTVIAIIVAFIFGSNIGKAISQVAGGAKRISKGIFNLDRKTIDSLIKRGDEIGTTAEAFDNMAKTLKAKAFAVQEIANGNMNADVHVASEEDELGHAMVHLRDQVNNLVTDINSTAQDYVDGKLNTRMNANRYNGAFAELVGTFTTFQEAVIKDTFSILDTVDEYGKGNLDVEMELFPGDKQVANERVLKVRDNLRMVATEIVGLANAATEGNLKFRGDASKYSGAYAKMVVGINAIVDNVMKAPAEAAQVLQKVADGDLTAKMTSDYKGDFNILKDALNRSIDSINRLLGEVTTVAEQVDGGATQVSSASQSLSQGATEQASSLEEVSATLTEIGSQTKSNADNAAQANRLAAETRKAADTGNTMMHNMIDAVEEMNEKSTQINKIIKVIEEIAFQTNLLALNAAVEAARAGVHGKGFAVVAEEVRNLAQRSAKAAGETTELIETNVESVERGASIADQTAESLKSIVTQVSKVSDLIDEIDSASREQTAAVEQVMVAMNQIDSVTQGNTANAEESASAAEELASQSAMLRSSLGQFKIDSSSAIQAQRRSFSATPASMPKSLREALGTEVKQIGDVRPEEVIALDDDDWANF